MGMSQSDIMAQLETILQDPNAPENARVQAAKTLIAYHKEQEERRREEEERTDLAPKKAEEFLVNLLADPDPDQPAPSAWTDLRERRKAKGQCPRCGSGEVGPGYVHCGKCRKKTGKRPSIL